MAAFEFKDMGYANDASSHDGFAGALNGQGMREAERLMGAAEKTVDLDHGAPEYQKAVSALSGVTEAVRQNNEYASSEPEDREQRVAELEAGVAVHSCETPHCRFMRRPGAAQAAPL
jgi:hypothetical protein